MKSPIKNKVKTVFLPVRNIEKAKAWYSKMLGIENREIVHEHLFVADMDGVDLVLDTMPMWQDMNGDIAPFNVPAIQFETDDIQASYQFMKENGVELVTEIQHNHWFVFRDPDGNMLMVCED